MTSEEPLRRGWGPLAWEETSGLGNGSRRYPNDVDPSPVRGGQWKEEGPGETRNHVGLSVVPKGFDISPTLRQDLGVRDWKASVSVQAS